MKPVIFGLAGPALTDDERTFFREAAPAGYILFKRNIENRAQVRALTDSLRDLAGRDDLAILIDQEGGRVARMQPPEWPAFPAGPRSEEHTSELQSLMRISYAVFCLKKKNTNKKTTNWRQLSYATQL